MRILPLIVLVACLVCQISARSQDDEPRPVNRGLLKRGLASKAKTTTTTPAPQEEAEYEDEGDYPAEAEAQEPSTEPPPSSTEGKKLLGGGYRPSSSNANLLEALKRRRAQAAGAKAQGIATASATQQGADGQTEAPVKSSYSKKRFNTATRETKNEDAPAPAPSKPSRGRFGRPSSRSFQEAEAEEQNDTTPPARTGRTFRRGN